MFKRTNSATRRSGPDSLVKRGGQGLAADARVMALHGDRKSVV